MSHPRIIIGSVLGIASGAVLAAALREGGYVTWCLGTLVWALALLLVLSALESANRPAGRLRMSATGGPRARLDRPSGLLGQALLRRGLVSRSDLASALAQQRGTSRHLGEILVEMRVLTRSQLLEAMEEHWTGVTDGSVWQG